LNRVKIESRATRKTASKSLENDGERKRGRPGGPETGWGGLVPSSNAREKFLGRKEKEVE